MDEQTFDIFGLLDEVRAIAQNGLRFSTIPYDRERYTRLLELAVKGYSAALKTPEEEFRRHFLEEMWHTTPSVDAAIFNQAGEILLMERTDGTGWCMPCGWVEPNEKPVEAVIREVREETGLEVEVSRLAGLFTRMSGYSRGPHTVITAVHLCEVTGGEMVVSHEGKNLKYWRIELVPEWHASEHRLAQVAYKMWQSGGTLLAVSD